ncbi:activating molecule in BECN1-regulated autophagy protein 1 [Paragonimus westermani]|uniref:Activating molecule in BECN1-regulated autophagy protein 1 n=1 Tax=Paragonimus westermani TaxID=34504 RepID=A0A5J4NGZ3_9TREM|nr:activating molecule in BECN1-regulated autophagy protein 1 [Paragonimus westermani]
MACCDHVNNVTSCNFVRYVNSRELGQSFSRLHQSASDAVTSHRHLKPLIADASPNCRSTYLLRLNQNNRLLAAAHGDKTVAIYCASTGRLLSRCVGHERSPWTLAFHPSQPYLLASGCLGGSIRLWNLESLATVDPAIIHQVYNLKSTKFWTHAGAIASLAFHPVHPILIAAWTQEVVFYDWVSGRKLSVWRFVSNQSRVRWVKFNPDGVLLYTATANPSLSQTAIVGKPRNNGSHCTEGSETRGNDAMSSSPQSSMQSSSAISSHNLISRDLLLEFLVGQPDAWFTQLGVCETCSFRLCRWAGTLGPKFPASTFDAQQSMKLVSRVAEVIAKQMRLTGIPLSRLVQELLSHRDQSSGVPKRLLLDADPVAVAVIEDMPVREFLLSRGNYCSEPSALTKDGSLCCGGHACDLVLAHRELMRHSVCRSCLAAFWRWASRYVDWWCFANGSFASLSSDCPNVDRKIPDDDSIPTMTNHFVGQDSNSTDLRMDQSISLTNPTITAGICIQCRAGVSGNHKPAPIDSLSRSVETSRSETPSKSRHLPLAALDLLRSRLSNANEVTPVTYMASDLISKGPLTDYIRKSLRSDATDYPMTSNLSRTLRLMCTTAAHVSSPLPKYDDFCPWFTSQRRKTDSISSLSDDQSAYLSNANMDTSHDRESYSSGKLAYTGQQTELSCNMVITCCGALRHRSLVQEAAELGRLIANRLDPGVWNRPRPVRLDTTYRVCRWELNLCDPVRNRANCSSDHGDTTDLKTGGPIHPMPANVAVSYNTNSLVIPHARLFNDSSICLSPDGRMLAAFVVPNANNSGRSRSHCFAPTGTINDAITSMDTLLAVYRLQPKARRGQCLFARRFTTASPVCLDFSPLSDYLAVGMATTRLPSADLPASSLRHLSSGSVTSGASQRELLNFDDFVVSDVQSAADNLLIPKRYECVGEFWLVADIFQAFMECLLTSVFAFDFCTGNFEKTNCTKSNGAYYL